MDFFNSTSSASSFAFASSRSALWASLKESISSLIFNSACSTVKDSDESFSNLFICPSVTFTSSLPFSSTKPTTVLFASTVSSIVPNNLCIIVNPSSTLGSVSFAISWQRLSTVTGTSSSPTLIKYSLSIPLVASLTAVVSSVLFVYNLTYLENC